MRVRLTSSADAAFSVVDVSSKALVRCGLRRLREQVQEGMDQLTALLESVMLLGQLAQDIALVKGDIRQVCSLN